MFNLIESRSEIKSVQTELERTIQREFAARRVKTIGYPGGQEVDETVFTDGQYWFWCRHHRANDVRNPRRLNWFGLFEPESNLQITVEINTPYEGNNAQIGGFFAKDSSTGQTYLMHSGRVAGGTKGVSKDAFFAWSNMRPVRAISARGEVRDGFPIMPIKARDATRSLIFYIKNVAAFKRAVRGGATAEPDFANKQAAFRDYYAESFGSRKGWKASIPDYFSRHGEVVDYLQQWRARQPLSQQSRIAKSQLIDLAVVVNNVVTEVFEVKTSVSRSDMYAAIGQLLVHGAGSECKRVLVIPNIGEPTPDIIGALDRLKITLIRFNFQNNTVAFD